MRVLCAIVSLDLTTALHRYFKLANDVLPSSTGNLSASVSPATIKGRGPNLMLALNAKIKTAKISSGGEMGFSRKFGPAKISRYTVCLWCTAQVGGHTLGKKKILDFTKFQF